MLWTLDDIAWDHFDPSKVDADLIRLVKAAAMVEFNGHDYGTYLCNVFSDDPDFRGAVAGWVEEEVQHGRALGKWAELADPGFDFKSGFARFTAGYRLPLDATESVRGSRSGELVARCIVESGTSSYYAALGDSTEEPVLKQICRNIAADEHRHYKLFYDYLKRYLDHEQIGRFRRLLVGIGRVTETEDDELAYAYYAANANENEPYERKAWSRAYMNAARRVYSERHLRRGIQMIMKAIGMPPQNPVTGVVSRVVYWRLTRGRPSGREAA